MKTAKLYRDILSRIIKEEIIRYYIDGQILFVASKDGAVMYGTPLYTFPFNLNGDSFLEINTLAVFRDEPETIPATTTGYALISCGDTYTEYECNGKKWLYNKRYLSLFEDCTLRINNGGFAKIYEADNFIGLIAPYVICDKGVI